MRLLPAQIPPVRRPCSTGARLRSLHRFLGAGVSAGEAPGAASPPGGFTGVPPGSSGDTIGVGVAEGVGLSVAPDVVEGATLLGDTSGVAVTSGVGVAVTSGVGVAFGLNTVGIDEGSAGVAVADACGVAVAAVAGISAVPTP
jgi:hypothetical protein